MIAGALLLFVAMTGSPQPPFGGLSDHDREIAAFASTMAIARTFGENCDGAQINEGYLEDLRQRLHVVESDHPRFAVQARSVVDSLKAGLSQAPSRQD